MAEELREEVIQETPVATPPQPIKKKSKGKKPLVLTFVVILGGLGLYLIFKGVTGKTAEPSPTPDFTLTVPSTPEPAETPEPVDKEEVTIEVLNGTGIAKEASFLQGKLADLGYKDIEAGNASSQDNTVTKATFSSSLPQEVIDEITEMLEETYDEVDVTTSRSLTDFDIEIITGLRKGQSPKPDATESPTSSPTATPTESPTATPTPATP